MKVIDLLVDKVNGKQLPNKIEANGVVFILDKDNKKYKREDGNAEEIYTDYMIDGFVDLTDEVEIIKGEKIIEKLGKYANVSGDLVSKWNFAENKLKDKINEIIDYIMEDKHD